VRGALQRLELIADTYLSVSTPVQLAAPALLAGRHAFQQRVLDRLRSNRASLLRERSAGAPWDVLPTEAGWSAILSVPRTRTEEEWALMRQHPMIGAQIVAPFEFFAGAALVIRHHHERWDGTGYPDGLAAAAIPFGARIVAVADVFDALTSDRPYRAALSRDAALAYLAAEAGHTLDADVVAALLGLVRVDGFA